MVVGIHPVRRRRLITILFISLGLSLAVAVMLYALKQNISLFYSPSQVASGEAPNDRFIRVGGMVVPGSVTRGEGMSVSFKVTDYQNTVAIQYSGILPDLFREGQGIVAYGQLRDDQIFQASDVLAKHDENYMPKEVRDTLKAKEHSE